jgi:polyisoprenoid-binding protein YceI
MNRFAKLTLSLLALAAPAFAADTYKVDPVHSATVFRIKHANASFFWGRFNEQSGTFALDEADPAKSSFDITINADSVDTNNEKRTAHVKSPDFFNSKQYPAITFKSTKVEKGDGDTLKVTGDLSFHGVTKPVTVSVELTGKGELPKGMVRAGIEATFTVKMSDFGIKGMPGALSDEVKIISGMSGVKQ